MSDTYSVIIQNKLTTEAFSKFQPLFLEAINNDRIGVCKWIESGTTLDTTVPELSELVNDKEEWRAIIVRLEDELPMSNFESDERNPFDFKVNQKMNNMVEESEIPLIRLTHMLGGVPAPEMQFVCEQVVEERKAPRMIYKPIVDKEQEAAYRKLCQKYRFDGKLPSSIIIVTIREGYEQEDRIEEVWTSRKESRSSEFWKRNRYPSNCRFLVYDFEKKGPVQRNADEFRFWLSILLLAINTTDSSTLQAYRLYKLNTKIDKMLMEDTIQSLVGKLKQARHVIEKEIKRDIESQLVIEDELPTYRIEVPVTVNVPNNEKSIVHGKGFGLFSQGSRTDISMWNLQKKEVEEKLSNSIRMAERTLDQTADRMRRHCVFSDEEVSGLDKYQIEDMIREIDDIYGEIVEIQGGLPTEDISADTGIVSAAKDVQQYLKGRVVGKNAFTALVLAYAIVILCQIPSIINLYVNGIGDILSILLVSCAECLIITLFAIVAIVGQKLKLDGLLRIYNVHIRSAFGRLTDSASDYSKYLSNIASHSRGYSYLNLMNRKKYQTNNLQYSKYKHIKAINILLSKLKIWSSAFYLKVDFEEKGVDGDVAVDTSISPSQNTMYTFETGNSYMVPINSSGIMIESPFCFAEKLEIIREELYDDNENI